MDKMQGGVRIRSAQHRHAEEFSVLPGGGCLSVLRSLTGQAKQRARSRTPLRDSVFPRQEEIGASGEALLLQGRRRGRNCILVFTAVSEFQENFVGFGKGNSYDIDLIKGTESLLSCPSISQVLLAWRLMGSQSLVGFRADAR